MVPQGTRAVLPRPPGARDGDTAPGEVAPRHNLYVVTRGLVLYGGRVLTRGQSWGDDVILSDQRYFLPYHARAMTYADVMVLDREKLTQVLCLFPESATRLRKKVIRLALRRHLIDARRSFIKKQRAGMRQGGRASWSLWSGKMRPPRAKRGPRGRIVQGNAGA